ncbi:MAG: non-ribosomal peptide synthetase [Woeseia sp.]
MTQFATLSEMLLARRESEHRLHFIDSDDDHRSLTFAELVAAALACLKTFQEQGFVAGDEIVIFTDNNQEFLTAFWAAILGGIVPVPVAVGISDEHRLKLFRILRQLKRASIFSNRGLFKRLRDFAGDRNDADIIRLLDSRGVLSSGIATEGEGKIHAAKPQDRAFIQYSSGSTSAPKGVCLTHTNVCTNMQAIVKGLQLTEQDRSFSWMPLTHDMGLIGYHISMLTANMHQAIMDTTVFVRRPLLWLQKVSELGSTVLCSPNFGYKHYLKVFERKGAGDVDLSQVRLLLNGAEPISVSLCEEFLAAMQPYGLRRETMLAVYGLAEATLAVTHPVIGSEYSYITLDRHQLRNGEPYVECAEGDRDAVRFVRLGTLFDGCDLRIADNDDVAVAAGHIGHVQLRGPNITEGIYGDEADEAGLFTADGWLRTGDCGAIANGELIITGRDKEIVIVNGQNYSPHDIEEVICELDELELGKVVVGGASPAGSQGEELLVFILYRKDPESFRALATAVRRVVGAQIGLEVDHVIPVARVPKTTSGKIQRSMLVQAYVDGEYDEFLAQERAAQDATAAAGGDADPLVRELELICAEFSKDQVVGPDDNLFEVGISSLTLTEIMLAIDEKYPGKADINDLFDYPTLRELAKFLRS